MWRHHLLGEGMATLRVGYFESEDKLEQICARCRTCELMCAFAHHNVGNPKRSRIRVVSLGGGVDIPVTCLNCQDPPCLKICPTGALKRDAPETMVTVDVNLCIGCSMCVQVCPIGAITVDPVDKVALKCDLCGGDPQCVKYCPAKVLKVTDSGNFSRHVMKRYARFLTSLGQKPECTD